MNIIAEAPTEGAKVSLTRPKCPDSGHLNLFSIYGAEIYLYQLGQAYRDYFICPIQLAEVSCYRIGILAPDGCKDCPFEISEGVHSDIEGVFAAARAYVDEMQAYWFGGAAHE